MKTIYKDFIIEKTYYEIFYDDKKVGDKTFYSITKEKDGKILFYRTARLESFKTAEQAKRAIKDNRVFVYAEMTA